MITGALLLFVVNHFVLSSPSEPSDLNTYDGITLFSEVDEVFEVTQFKVLQVVENGNALAFVQSDILSSLLPDDAPSQLRNLQIPTETIVLLLAGEKDYYYDDEVVNVPSNKCVRHIGIYKYITTDDFEKTVPIVDIFEK